MSMRDIENGSEEGVGDGNCRGTLVAYLGYQSSHLKYQYGDAEFQTNKNLAMF